MSDEIDSGSEIQIRRTADGWLLTTQQWVPTAIEEVFDFFADAGNLELLTPPWLNFQILTPQPIAMGSGTLIDYRLRLKMVPIRWRTEIKDWNPPHSFVDTQLRGPYTKWIHTHTFTEVNGGTLCEDHVAYDVPFGWIAHPLLVKRDLTRIFGYRQQQIARTFGTSSVETASAAS